MKRHFFKLLKGAILPILSYGEAELKTVLTTLGLEANDIEAITKIDDTNRTTFKPEDYVGKVRTGLETSLLNDNTFLEKLPVDKLPEKVTKAIEASQYGRFMGEFRTLATKRGIDISDLSGEEYKSLSKLGEKIFEKYAGKLGSPDAVNKLQNELQQALQSKTEVETSVPTKISEAVNKVKGETSSLIKSLVTTTELGSIEGLKVSPRMVVDSVIKTLEAKYSLVVEGTNIELRQKENPQLKVVDTAGKELTFAEAVKAEAVAGKLVDDKKKEEDKSQGSVTVEVGATGFKTPSYIGNKINQNIEAEKKA